MLTRTKPETLAMTSKAALLAAAVGGLFVISARPLSLHGVGLSLGSVDPLDRVHLAAIV